MNNNDKLIIKYAIRSIVREQMLLRRMGTWDEELKTFDFTKEEFDKIIAIINDDMFPSGYYGLCDLIGEKYV